MVLLHGTRGLVIDGVTLLNSPNHNIMLQDSLHVRIRRLRVHAPSGSPNTDGVNFCGGADQIIEDSHISNGDDCMSIAPSWWTPGMGYGGNVVARNVTCENGHGISTGLVSHGTVTNVTVEDIRFYDSRNGVRIKAYPNNTGLVSGITFRNVQLTRVKTPIVITGNYCPHPPCPPGSVAVLVRDITFEDIRGTGNAASGVVGRFDCSEISPCTGITLRRVQLQLVGGGEARFRCEHASGPVAHNVTPKSCVDL